VFGNRVLRRMVGPKKEEVMGHWRKLHGEKLNDLCTSPDVILVIKSKRMRWRGREENVAKRKMHTGFWWVNMK
jgi:hypothetical protein